MTRHVAIAIVAVLFVLTLGAALRKAWAHDPYSGWLDRKGFSCCDMTDCRPTRAEVDERGQWRAMVDGRWVTVPADAVLAIPSPDGRSHICMTPEALEPRCFVPGEIRG